jgi:hypothetical protein
MCCHFSGNLYLPFPPHFSHSLNHEFHIQMAREMDEILRQQIAQPANSCNSDNGVSFLDEVISPLYEVVSAVCFFLFIELT